MNKVLNTANREQVLQELETHRFDLVIIGGGITGAGILREATLKGLSAALIEAEDFASGTSSKSTKLIHGGLRYLAMGHIPVVREAARERKRVAKIAPHLAEPKWLMVPAVNRVELLKYRLGISVYERLGQVDKTDRHFSLTRQRLADQEPLLNQDNFPFACLYREYLTDDARLVMGNLRAGVYAGGLAINRMRVSGLIKDYSRINGVRAICSISGEEIIVRGKVVINAAGPWVEEICSFDGLRMHKPMVLSKGIHVVISRHRLPVGEMVFMVAKDDRPIFVIPRGDVVYIGTTDKQHPQGAETWPEVEAAEIDYVLEPIQKYFGVKLERSDCLMTWAGLRPLIHEQGKSTKEISRKDEVWVSHSGLVTIAGGKLTGYRKMAEEAVLEACRLMGIDVGEHTADDPLPGGDIGSDLRPVILDVSKKFGIREDKAARLIRLYGSECQQVLQLGSKPVVANGFIMTGEILWAIQEESAQGLEDVLYRRTRAALYKPLELEPLIQPTADLMAKNLGWSADRKTIEIGVMYKRLQCDIPTTTASWDGLSRAV